MHKTRIALLSPDFTTYIQIIALDLGSSSLGSSNFGNSTYVNP